MKACKPVPIARGAFIFCRWSLAIIFWLAFFLRLKILVVAGGIILALSALLTIRRAPMIALYTATVQHVFPSRMEILDEYAMRFAHGFGTVLAGICAVLLYSPVERIGWGFLLFFAVAKTVGALGYCTATKLYHCMSSNGGCCSLTKRQHE